MTSRDKYLFCYENSCPQRRRHVHKLLVGYRVVGQKSVFECLRTAAEFREVVASLRLAIVPAADRIHVLALDPRTPRHGSGKAQFHDGGPLPLIDLDDDLRLYALPLKGSAPPPRTRGSAGRHCLVRPAGMLCLGQRRRNRSRRVRCRTGSAYQHVKVPVMPQPATKIWFVSRHPGALEWARQHGLRWDQALVHLDGQPVATGDRVYGTLPLSLAAGVCEMGAEYWHLQVSLSEDMRGRELSAEELADAGARFVRYEVRSLGEHQ